VFNYFRTNFAVGTKIPVEGAKYVAGYVATLGPAAVNAAMRGGYDYLLTITYYR
jgi:hypothetical protein